MTELIACLSTGKGTWVPVINLIENHEWDQIFIIGNEFAREKFQPKKEVEFIIIDSRIPPKQMVDVIKSQLENKIKGIEVALNLTSGTGNEHMAIMSAILKLGLGVRLVSSSQTGVEEI